MIPFVVRIDEKNSLRLSRRVRREIYTATWRAVADRWQKKWLPRHFARRARTRYNYAPRTEKWKKYKKWAAANSKTVNVKKGGRVDIVFTGLTERQFRRRHAVRAFPTRATISMHGSKYITMRLNRKNKKAMGQEIVRHIPEEIRDLADVAEKTLALLISKAPSRTRRLKAK